MGIQLEKNFQSKLIKELREIFPESVILKNDPNYLQGFPDILILHNNKWAALETKRKTNSFRQPNQNYYIERLNDMSFACFICPENKEQVLYELQQSFRA